MALAVPLTGENGVFEMIRAATFATATLTAAFLLSTSPSVEAREVACDAGTSLKARNGDTKSTITFTNRTPDKQTVYWIDYDGKRHKYQDLDPGESYDQPTFLTHPWLVTGAKNKCVGFYLAEGKTTSVEPGIAPVIMPIKKEKKVAELPKSNEQVTVRKPASSFRTPGAELPDDDFDTDDRADTKIARRKIEPALDDQELSDSDFENDDDLAQTDDDIREDDLASDTTDLDDPDRRDDEDDVAIVEPLPRTPGSNRRAISPEWGDEPLTTGRQGRISRNWRCTEYSTRTEKAICNDGQLARLDDELERLYSSLVRALPRVQRTKLRRRQQDWLEDREACGRRSQCIERRTKQRLARLNRRMERVIERRGSRGNDRRFARIRTRSNGALPIRGESLGGRVRDIPGLDGRRVATLREGTPVTVLESTGERHRGYEWFKIRFAGQTGYTWGGILCTSRRVPGVFNVCR